MIYSLEGTVVEVSKDRIALSLGPIAYEVFVARSADFSVGETPKIYTSEVLTQDDHYLVGFPDKLEKEAFLSLISVKGIGPKTALSALGATKTDELFAAIEANNTAYLKKLPGIGPKAAAQIILDLKGKLVKTDEKGRPEAYEEVASALKSLGFKKADIDRALSSINEPNLDNAALLRLALRQLRKE